MKRLKNNTLPRTVNGLYELASFCESGQMEEQAHADSSISQWNKNSMNASWAGTTGRDAYNKAMDSPDRAIKGLEIAGSLQMSEGFAMDLVPSIEGQFNDPVAFLTGEPECMADFAEQPINNYKTIVWAAAVPGMWGLDDMKKVATAISEAVNALELAQTRVRVELFFISQGKIASNRWRLILKDHQDSYIPHVHGAALGDFATVRGLGYAYWSRFSTQAGLGFAVESEQLMREGYAEAFGEWPEEATLVSSELHSPDKIKELLSVR